MSLTEWVFGIFGVASFCVAVWQYFENKYNEKIAESRDKEINNLMRQNQKMLTEINKDTTQAFKQKDMNRLLPTLLGSKNKPDAEVVTGLKEIKEELNKLKKEYPQNQSAVKKIVKLDTQLDRTLDEALTERRDNLFIGEIKTIDDLKGKIKFFEWLNEQPRFFSKRISKEKNELTGKERINYIAFDFPESPTPYSYLLEHYKHLIEIGENTARLTERGKELLARMKQYLTRIQGNQK